MPFKSKNSSDNSNQKKSERPEEKLKKKEFLNSANLEEKKSKPQESDEKKDKNERKPSYIERAMITFIKDKLIGGFDALKKPQILPFSIIAIGILFVNFILAISLAQLNNQNILDWLKLFLLIHLIIAVGLVVFGTFSALFKNPKVQQIFVLSGLTIGIILIIFYREELIAQDLLLFDAFRTAFLIIWIINSCVSLFFMFLYLFTGLPGKMITAGKSPDHIFLEQILTLGGIVSIGFSILMMIRSPSLNSYIIGGLGIIAGLLVIYFTLKADRNESNVNFATVIGLYNLYIAYQLSGGIERSESLPNMLTELILLVFIALYNIKNLTMKLESMDMEQLEKENQFREVFFQKRTNIFPKIKKVMGDFPLILIALGVSIGYFNFVIFSYISPEFPILGGFIDVTLGLSVISKRLFTMVSTCLLISMSIIFFRSARFRDMLINKYNLKQAFRIAGDVVRSWGRRIKFKWQTRKEDQDKEDDEFIEMAEK